MKPNLRLQKLSAENFHMGEIYKEAQRAQAKGISSIHMDIGKPDADSPLAAKQAASQALEEGFVHYTPSRGIPALCQAIANKERKAHGTLIDPQRELIVTSGACEALMCVFLGLFEAGDEILVPSPYFMAYRDMATISGVTLVEVPLSFEEGFSLQEEVLLSKRNARTRAILLNSPHNPTGAVYPLKTLEMVARMAKKYDLWVISDETYDAFLYQGSHKSIWNVSEMKERTILINSASKLFSMTGWRIGYLAASGQVLKALNRVHQTLSVCANSFAQIGAAQAYRQGQAFSAALCLRYQARGRWVSQALADMPGIRVHPPQGAFYVFPQVEGTGLSEEAFCIRAAERGVLLMPGRMFGEAGKGHVRLAYTCPDQELREGLDRLRALTQTLCTSS